MLPLECQYLNKNALTTLAGPLTPPVKHFQLKRKPKSATLRAELLQKCECRGLRPPGVGAPCPAGPGRSCRLGEPGCWQAVFLFHVSGFYSEVSFRFYGT